MRARATQALLWIFGAIAAVAAGYFMDQVSIRGILMGVLMVAGTAILLLPYDRAIQVLFFYLGIEGFAKIMTRYNPVVHVGADLLVTALVARYVLTSLSRGKIIRAHLPPFWGLFALHFLWFSIAILNPYALSWVASVAAAKMYVTMPLLYIFGYYLATDGRKIRGFMLPWLIVAVAHVVTSLYQSSIGPKSVTSLSPQYSVALEMFRGYAFRPFGLTALPGGPSIYLFIITPFLAYFFLSSRSVFAKAGLAALFAGTGVTMMVCQVRSALLKGIIGLVSFVGAVARSMKAVSTAVRVRIVGFALVLVVLVAVLIPRFLADIVATNQENKRAVERSLSLFDFGKVSQARSGAWVRFVLYARNAPLGAGLSRTGAAAGKFKSEIQSSPFFREGFFADNFWVATVVDLGIPGMLILTTIVLGLLLSGALKMGKFVNHDLGLLHSAILCSLVSIVVGFYGAESILYNPEAAFFWFFAGVMAKLPEIDRAFAHQDAGKEAVRAGSEALLAS